MIRPGWMERGAAPTRTKAPFTSIPADVGLPVASTGSAGGLPEAEAPRRSSSPSTSQSLRPSSPGAVEPWNVPYQASRPATDVPCPVRTASLASTEASPAERARDHVHGSHVPVPSALPKEARRATSAAREACEAQMTAAPPSLPVPSRQVVH